MSIQGLLNKNMAANRGNGIDVEDTILTPMRSMWLERQVTIVKNGNHYDVTCERQDSITKKWLEITKEPFKEVHSGNGSFAGVLWFFIVPYAIGSLLILGVTSLFMSVALAVDLAAKKISIHGNQNAKAYQSIIEKTLAYDSIFRGHVRSNKTLDQLSSEIETAKARKEEIEKLLSSISHSPSEIPSTQAVLDKIRIERELKLANYNVEYTSSLYEEKAQEQNLREQLRNAIKSYHQLSTEPATTEEIDYEFNDMKKIHSSAPTNEGVSLENTPASSTQYDKDKNLTKEESLLKEFKELHTQIMGLKGVMTKISEEQGAGSIMASIETLKKNQSSTISILNNKINGLIKEFSDIYDSNDSPRNKKYFLRDLSAAIDRNRKILEEMEAMEKNYQ